MRVTTRVSPLLMKSRMMRSSTRHVTVDLITFFGPDDAASCCGERDELEREVLIRGADARVADPAHHSSRQRQNVHFYMIYGLTYNPDDTTTNVSRPCLNRTHQFDATPYV